MDVTRIIYTFRQHGDRILWVIVVVAVIGVFFRALTVLTTTPAYDAVLPESPAPADNTVPVTLNLKLSLFKENNAWSEFSTSEMRTDDKRLLDAPASRLPLKIVGILFNPRHDKSLAIVASGTKQFTAGEGERLDNSDLSIARIFNDRVIIINQGLYEALYLEMDSRG